ncbi:hypothetical protein [Hwanghaeella sp.]|uniref:hypothetical protein n=1 Tax=Hwanghaeella sp. TaxID=2605943 RepID=UPI003CCC33EE
MEHGAWTGNPATGIVAAMSLLASLQRLLSFGGSARPTTEEFQRVILTHVSMQGPVVLAEIGRTSFPSLELEMRRYGLVEAAQILVNRGEITASRNGASVDPVNTDWTDVVVAQKTQKKR